MKKVLAAVAVVATGIALATVVSLAGNTAGKNRAYANPTSNDCVTTKDGINVNGANANADVKVSCGPQRNIVLKAWYAESANGLPHDTQRLVATSDAIAPKASDADYTHVKLNLPDTTCYYQIDLVDTNGSNDVLTSVTGGNHDCRQIPSYSCSALGIATDNASRKVVVNNFVAPSNNATLSKVVIAWGDGTSTTTNGSALNADHTYGTSANSFNLTATAYFTHKDRFGNDQESAAPVGGCTAQATFTTTTPPATTQQVCELSSGKTVTIPGGSYDTTKYGPTSDSHCNKTVTVVTKTTPAAQTLTNTGPGSVIAMFAAAVAAGFAGRTWLLRRRANQ